MSKAMREIAMILKMYPELRVGQVIANAAKAAGYGGDLYYCPDETLEEGLHKFLALAIRIGGESEHE